MSDYENWTGKLIPQPRQNGESIEEQKKKILVENNIDTSDYYEGLFEDSTYNDYIIINDLIYKIEGEDDKNADGSHCRLHKDKDGNYNFSARFYNGGTCLSEMLEDAFNKESK